MKELYNKKNFKKYNKDFIDIKEIINNINEFLNIDYDLDLIKRVENNEPISRPEYFYFEYTLPVKLMCLNHLLRNVRRKNHE